MAKDGKPQEPRSRGTDAPKCKICEIRHWSHQPHVFAVRTKVADVVKARVKKIETEGVGKKKPAKRKAGRAVTSGKADD